MQNNSQPKLIPIPFASNGAKQDIPNSSQIGVAAGRASYPDGFPPLTRTPLAAGGVPPFGTDFNGILNDITAALRWSQSGSGYPYNAQFNTAISGYPKGACIPLSSLDGYWLNTVDANASSPEVSGAGSTGWVPLNNYGITAISGLSGSSLTLTTLQAAKDRITLDGTLTANINLIFPAWRKQWTIVNRCSGNFVITIKTPSGTGVQLTNGAAVVVYGDGTNVVQDSVTFNAITAPAGDVTNKVASTEFVKNAGLQVGNIFTINAAQSLSSAYLGAAVNLGGSGGYTVTLPTSTNLPSGLYGKFISFVSVSSGDVVIGTTASDNITAGNGSVSSITLKSGDRALIYLSSANFWTLFGGEASLKYAGSFSSSFSGNGYQRLPTGLIIQWGISNNSSTNPATTTLPIAFPNTGLIAVASDFSISFTPTTSIGICGVRFLSNSQIQVATAYQYNTLGAEMAQWFAIGY